MIDMNAGIIPPPAPNISPVVDTPIPAPIQEAEVVADEAKVEHKYRVVRGSGDPVYLIKDNYRHWVMNLQVMEKLGYKLGEEEKLTQAEMNTFVPGKAITMENVGDFL